MAGKIRWNNWVKELSGKNLQCTVCSVQSSSAPQFVEGALVFLSLWREPGSYSVWGVEHFDRLLLCLTPPEEVVLIFRQGGPTKLTLSDNLGHLSAKFQAVPILQHGGSNSLNGQNLSVNMDHKIN